MHLQDSHQASKLAINAIIDKGGKQLYQGYLKMKLPNHAKQQISKVFQVSFQTPYSSANKPSSVNTQQTPEEGIKQALIPFKISKINEYNPFPSNVFGNLSFRKQFRSKKNVNKNQIYAKKQPKSERQHKSRSNIINESYISLQQNQESINQQTSSIRKDKYLSNLKQERNRKANEQLQNKKHFRRTLLKNKIQQSEKQGVPYIYDQQGNIILQDLKQFKKLQLENKITDKREKRFINIKFQTLDLISNQRYSMQQGKHILGRKRGYFSSKYCKKLKLTNQEFNNQNSRQNSNVPFLSLNQGIRIVQRQKNIIAQKTRRHQVSIDEYKQKTQSNFFKSFMPDYDFISMQTMSVQRPHTTAQMNRTKKTSETISSSKMQSSILWRPRTTNKNCKMNINNQQLAKRVSQID